MIEEGLKLAEISNAEFEELPGSDLRKVALAELIASRTTMGTAWINEELKMRSATNAIQ